MYVNIKNSGKELQRMLDRNGAVNQIEEKIKEIEKSLENIDLSDISTEKDWNENNPEGKEYIKNRTHYVDTPAFEFSWTEEDGSIIPKSLGLEAGKEYFCTGSYRTSNDGGSFEDVYVAEEIDGNIVLNRDGNYFTIIDNPQNNQTTIKGWAFSLRIFADAEGFHTLDERFIPETIARKEDVDKNIAEIKEDTIFGKTNKTYSKNDVMFGEDNTVGTKAFYISSIDMENKQIYLSTKKVDGLPSLTEHTIDDEIFDTNAYKLEVGDVFSIINNIHYPLCGVIVDIDGDNGIITYGEATVELGNQYRKVTFPADLPFTEFLEDTNIDGHTIYFYNKPEIGSVAIKGYSFSVGQYNIGAGKWSFTQGWNNIVNDDLGVAFGDRNIVGYNATAFGALNIANGERSFAEGQRTQAWGINSHAAGQYTIAKGKNQFVIGQFNIPDENSLFIIGNGTNENSNISNAMTVDGNGNTWIAGDLTCGKDKIKMLAENRVFNGTHVILGAGHTVPTDPAHTYSMILGYQNKINNKWNVSLGVQNESISEVTTTIGFANKSLSTGGYNVLIGVRNVANQSSTWAIGKDLITQEYEQMVVGRSNVAETNAVFVVGNGTNATNRANAMVIRKTNNNVEFAGNSIKKAGKELATEEYVSERMDLVLGTGAPETLNSIAELAAAMNNDPNFKEALATKDYVDNKMSDINGESHWDYNEENNSIVFGNSLLKNAFSVGYGCMPTTENSQSFGYYTSIGVKGYKTTSIDSSNESIIGCTVNSIIDNDTNSGCSTAIAVGTKVYALTCQSENWQLIEIGNVSYCEESGIVDIEKIEGCPDLGDITTTPMIFLETPRKTELQPGCLGDVMAQGPDVMCLTPEQVTGLQAQGIKISSAMIGHTEGYFTYIGGNYAHAQNNRCRAIGNSSDAGGQETWARGGASMTRGEYTQTMPGAAFSFARGKDTICHGACTEASGLGNEAYRDTATVRGKYATLDTAKKYLDMVGNGASATDRKNIYTLSKDGVLWVPKGMRVGGASQDDEAAQTVATLADLSKITPALPENLVYEEDLANFATKDDIDTILLEIINAQKEIVGGEL